MTEDRKALQLFLSSDSKLITESRNVVTYLWRHILQTALPPTDAMGRWEGLMRTYVAELKRDPSIPRENIPKNASSAKGNLRKELLSPQMTWLNFIKGLYFLRLHRAVFRVECYWRDGSTSAHCMTLYERGGQATLERAYLKDILTDLWLDIQAYAFLGEEGENQRHPKNFLLLWSRLVEQYLDDPRNNIGNSKKKRMSVKGNLRKELLPDEYLRDQLPENHLSWKSFEKGMCLLNPQKTEYTITCFWQPTFATHHTVTQSGSRVGYDATTALNDH